ncbi:ATP synthase complex assembly protein atp12 [Trapelia coarctata]|nr:ATP synthase complex assembly protein atp12 [Trapelia coarctata]
MKAASRSLVSSLSSTTNSNRLVLVFAPHTRCIHTSPSKPATPLPFAAAGPPPSAPLPAASQYGERVDRRRRQAELLKRGQDLRASQMKPGSAMKKRFWKDVSVKTTSEGHHTIHLDTRPVRHPSTKSVLPIPPSKPHLATAIALEWDLLVSAQQALKQHLIPLTSMASRAYDISLQDAGKASGKSREEIVTMLMRYLDTDTLLCWAPAKSVHDAMQLEQSEERGTKTLRDLQIRVAQPIIAFLTSRVWPGVEIKPVLDDRSIVPVSQPQETRDVIRGWISGLGPWELAGLERAVLASKSLCVGARLVVEWSENFRDVRQDKQDEVKFGIEEAAEACSLEVRWQTGMWGEVEDTHDVEKEDLRRQLGSVILVVDGRS